MPAARPAVISTARRTAFRPAVVRRAVARTAVATSVLAVAALVLAGCASGTSAGDGTDAPSDTSTTAPDAPTSSDSDAGGGAAGTRPSGSPSLEGLAADLTVSVDASGEGDVQVWTLTCDPPGGDHPDPEWACAALEAAGGVAAFEPVPRTAVCTEIYGGPQTAHVEGTVGGEPVNADFSRQNGCEIARWDALQALLGDVAGV
ncbi:subtilase-type protease inhibitor [Actinotalea sp. M2MS4P-6]|uniref:subtilase-type protease inhibitor n=1 Tax=Actinotalea sp. M2MS4P-6 TaxID=2983762 RepID=UPI0021E4D2E5|nr:subtilase-type protease inhibitor [Actinotalea sp. M2MS4P-6]MCV2393168.1 subtilase-type protease inhibitor [Actinotalea sp. M2MS4P-6]